MTGTVDLTPLDDPFTCALTGRQERFARRRGRINAFEPEVSVFFGHPREMTDADWVDMAALAGPGNTVGLRDCRTPAPPGWRHVETFDLVQYSGEDTERRPDPELVRLGPPDVAEMTELVTLTKPGPFLPRTVEMGVYLGYRDGDGRLLAMAGQRLRLPGWVEISAVCTHPEARGRGLARRLVAAVAQVIVDDGDLPFLHTTAENPARSLYEAMGFVLRSEVSLEIVRVPEGE
ncbi:GNAT family N-acetyltransferase [Gordonia sihwensis]|uniref:GNAT family N-acetyltransferase n=1 Tax=Gordonia TaxID=2053 RepID=UPI001C92BBA7|nr:GNAT family N-acetyltransferase [Gordonia sihwensis]MBY4569510.1 GNAT family N-acetyltransferase [Gordonia sihwensis]WFN94024.1 GNAT family N-acetyltransferase [Gordonia sihwensis]